MKLFAGLFFPGLSLVLLSCCCRVQAGDQIANLPPAASNGTNHTSTAPVVKPGNITIPAQNGSEPAVSTAVPPNSTTTSATTTTNTTTTTTNITTITVNVTTAKTSTTKAPPAPSKSTNVTTGTPVAPSSVNTTAVTATAKAPANLSRSSGFDVGSFIGGIVLSLGLLIIGYIGCRTYHAKRGVQYRTIDEHDAII